ncbi:hypothetical protein [Duganella sp. Root198D2]|uniref:hypothetical protein n=1 Tax=Duganella sp. Root198D2 TaxID=1736489 RepID=UPI0012E39DEF|nr:hypothetical protein [Duganella sp. Root198D2]
MRQVLDFIEVRRLASGTSGPAMAGFRNSSRALCGFSPLQIGSDRNKKGSSRITGMTEL